MYLLLILLASTCHGYDGVFIVPQTKVSNASVTAQCNYNGRATYLDAETFGLTPSKVKYKLDRLGMSPPNIDEVRLASFYGDIFVEAHLRVTSAKVVNVEKKTDILLLKYFINNSSRPTTINFGVNEQIMEKLNIRWFPSNELAVGRRLYVNFRGTVYKTSYNKMEKDVRFRTLSTKGRHNLTLKPWQNVTLTLTAVKVRLDVVVGYVCYLSGQIHLMETLFIFPVTYRTYDVNDYFNLVGVSPVLTSDQLIFLDYYYGAELLVHDGRTGELLADPIKVQ